MARRSMMRASDADRDRVTDRLRHATGEGRLAAEELEERLTTVFSARTYGELDAVVADLPAQRDERRHTVPLWARAGIVLAAALAVMAVAAMVVLVAIGLAGAWMVWVFLMWLFLGRGRHVRRMGHSRHRARAVRNAMPRARVPGGGGASL